MGAEAVAPYERPPLSKAGLAQTAAPKFIAPAESYADSGICLLLGATARYIDPQTKVIGLHDDSRLNYDKLLLATGALAKSFPGIGGDARHIRSLRTHADALALRAALGPDRHIAIIGGGFIGLEVAATARTMGAKVTLVEGLPRVLMRGVPGEIARIVAERHSREGVNILCNQAIAAIEEGSSGPRIVLAGGDTIAADLVLVGIGALPNVALAEAAGLAIDNGIAVNARLETSMPDIYAAGDCCSFPLEIYSGRRVRLESWRNAQEQAMLAAANMLGAQEVVSAVPWFWSDQYDLTLQIAGLPDGAVVTLRRDLGDGAFLLFHLDEGGRLVAASGIGQGNIVARDIRLAEMLIAKRARPAPNALTANTVKLKSLLVA
jgi:3-phenylpropionate/trans-cinnamate dioxygenase ferredoxin reductase subunit